MNEHKPFEIEEVDRVETPPRARVEETPAEILVEISIPSVMIFL